MTRVRLTHEQIVAVRIAKRGGATWEALARRHGVSIEGLRCAVDPDYRARRNAYKAEKMRASYQSRPRRPQNHRGPNAAPPDIEPRRIVVPAFDGPDTIVGVLMGDPPPARSALGQKLGL